MKKITFLLFTFLTFQLGSAQATYNVATKSLPMAYEQVESRPMFPGGDTEFINFIGKNFHVPEVEGINGVIKVTFVIETNGSISDINVVKDLGSGTGEEAKRVLQLCPKWTPGEHDGKPVRVMYTLPITIRN